MPTRFDGAQFTVDASFYRAQFSREARFDGAQFSGHAGFTGALFDSEAVFWEAQFNGIAGDGYTGAQFDLAQFSANARFDRAQFSGHARFVATQFSLGASFRSAQFSTAQFTGALFSTDALFDGVRFSGYVWFHRARFSGLAVFAGAQFNDRAEFDGTRFNGNAVFDEARFNRNAVFNEAQFDWGALFRGTRFEGSWFGPMACRSVISAVGATVMRPMRVQIAAARVNLSDAQFMAPAVFSVRYGAVDLTDVAADAPVTITSHPLPFTDREGQPFEEPGLSGDSRASVISLAGVDAANIVLSDVDLSGCVFSGAHHLDQIRLESRCEFTAAPRGWTRILRIPVRRWTRRTVLAEEAAWHADPHRGALARAGWSNPDSHDEPVPVPSPAQLAVLYRQLRKALEDARDVPGAADFYYGEMEARRHDTEGTPRAERALLHWYWLLSGYALRASRALAFLAATATFLLLLTVGLPDNQLDLQITGTLPSPGAPVTLTQSTPDPALTLPLGRRFSTARANQAGLVVVNSVIFRSTDTTLTKPGTWIEIISRISEPVLLGFAAVAARGRVQR